MLTTRHLGRRLFLIIIAGKFLIASLFILNNYSSSKNQLENGVLTRLHCIAATTALQIDGDAHQTIIEKYKTKDALKSPLNDPLTLPIYTLLRDVKSANNLNTDIYTLFLDDHNHEDKIFMGIMSGNIQYFRHTYFSHPKELLENFQIGGKLPMYSDEHGSWLSAFAPIKNNKGETVAVIHADERFDVFAAQLKSILIRNILISIAIISIIAFVMLYIINRIVILDTQKTHRLELTYKQLQEQNKKVTDSINYAVRIQSSIVATPNDLSKLFPNSFMYYKPKDVVSGDFPWLMKKKDCVYIAVVDCTGHGVPGAMLSFVGHFLLNEINGHSETLSPAEILTRLHRAVKKTLKQEEGGDSAHDGMDIGLCRINLKSNELEFSGAHRGLFIIQDNTINEIKGTRRGIGGTQYDKLNRSFINHKINLNSVQALYFFSDGFPDQIGGDESKKFGSKRTRLLLESLDHSNMSKVHTSIEESFESWKDQEPQLDDVLMIGIGTK